MLKLVPYIHGGTRFRGAAGRHLRASVKRSQRVVIAGSLQDEGHSEADGASRDCRYRGLDMCTDSKPSLRILRHQADASLT